MSGPGVDVDYARLAVDQFELARSEAADLRTLAGRLPVWEELAARFAAVTARFAEAAAAAALARMARG